MNCPACHKRLPETDRFCVYCGADLGWRLLPGLSVPRINLPPRWQVSGTLAAVLGVMVGALLGLLFENAWAGALVGGVGLGASAMLGEVLAAAIPDRSSAERFGQALGAFGGSLVLPVGLLTGLIVSIWRGSPDSLRGLAAFLAGGLYLGLICALGGALVGAACGVIAGGFTGRMGYALLRRRGAVLGAAAAWTAAAVAGGLFAGDYAGRIAGVPTAASATLGVILQVLGGALLLPVVRRIHWRWQGWLTGRP